MNPPGAKSGLPQSTTDANSTSPVGPDVPRVVSSDVFISRAVGPLTPEERRQRIEAVLSLWDCHPWMNSIELTPRRTPPLTKIRQNRADEPENGAKPRLDDLLSDPTTDAIRCIECKSSATARLTPRWRRY